MKLTLRSSLLALSTSLFFLTSCGDNENDLIEANESTSENQELITTNDLYNYEGKLYTEQELKSTHPMVLDVASYFIYEATENTFYVYTNEKEYKSHSSSVQQRNDFDPTTWGFKLRMWEHENYGGRFVEWRYNKIKRSRRWVGANVPGWFNDRASSIVIDDVDRARFPNKNQEILVHFRCFEHYGYGGRQDTATLWFRSKRTFDNLRGGDWNDRISSWQVLGGDI
ncbi:hypothetical protein [uncultured Tenacibaculum sp.]|uniref:hypothetical protein n=1 Tax=uncultured Tenacibaculum sp. TaxID=174713 RepID=UPI00261E7896|nr:hypothetical protein [uncultured Tenacibaculum sp.]